MREKFDEYKKTIETNIFKFTYLYDGDIKSSKKVVFSKSISHRNTSPSFIIECIIDIYRKSINNMIESAIKIDIPCGDLNLSRSFFPFLATEYISEFENKNKFRTRYLFSTNDIYVNSNQTKQSNKNGLFPAYFYPAIRYSMLNYDFYQSPLISKVDDQIDLYITDSAIQSLVYSLQNMEYIVDELDGEYNHKIVYDLYDCDFKSYRLCIKDISKLRNDKIEILLNGN